MTRLRPSPILATWLVLALTAALVLGACGGGDDDDDAGDGGTTTTEATTTGSEPPADPGPVSGDAVTIQGFDFGPNQLAVAVGTTVTWTNEDPTSHTATADDGAFDTETLAPGDTGEFTFEDAGTFEYHCEIHPSMSGSVTVE